MKVVFSSAADRDLENIRQYTSTHAPDRVLDLIYTIIDRCQKIADGPLRYPLVASQAARGLRRRRYEPYLIFFRGRGRPHRYHPRPTREDGLHADDRLRYMIAVMVRHPAQATPEFRVT